MAPLRLRTLVAGLLLQRGSVCPSPVSSVVPSPSFLFILLRKANLSLQRCDPKRLRARAVGPACWVRVPALSRLLDFRQVMSPLPQCPRLYNEHNNNGTYLIGLLRESRAKAHDFLELHTVLWVIKVTDTALRAFSAQVGVRAWTPQTMITVKRGPRLS